jgi:hypothetical protein
MPARGIVLSHIIENMLCVVKNAILIVVFMNMFTGLVARVKPRLEEGLRLFINEQPILMRYVHVPPLVRGVNTERGTRELVKRNYQRVKANPFLAYEPLVPCS